LAVPARVEEGQQGRQRLWTKRFGVLEIDHQLVLVGAISRLLASHDL
jgi:hypothetical protein